MVSRLARRDSSEFPSSHCKPRYWLTSDRAKCMKRITTGLLIFTMAITLAGRVVGAETMRLALPGPAEQMIVGGEGRYLIIMVREAKSVFVIDLENPSLRQKISIPQDHGYAIAANRSELIVAETFTTLASRYKLADLSLVSSNRLFSGAVKWIGMGAASDGPLWVCTENYKLNSELGDMAVHDPRTFRKVKHLIPSSQPRPRTKRERADMRYLNDGAVSDDGTTFVDTYRELLIQMKSKRPTVRYFNNATGVPNFSGTDLLGTFPPMAIDAEPPIVPLSTRQIIPGCCTTLFALLQTHEKEVRVTVYDAASYRASGTLAKPLGTVTMQRAPELDEQDRMKIQINNPRMRFLPRAGWIARIERQRTELALYPIELADGWEDSIRATVPPVGFAPVELGKPMEYQIPVPAGCKIKTCRLILGPAGMSVTDQGRLAWKAPPRAESQECDALIQVVADDDSLSTHRVVMTVGTAAALNERGLPESEPKSVPLVSYEAMLPGDLAANDPSIDRTGIVKMPSRVSQVSVAAEGDYLIMAMPDIESLGVFDVLRGKFVGYLSHRAKVFAGSVDSLFLGDGKSKTLEQWSIPQLTRLSPEYDAGSRSATRTSNGLVIVPDQELLRVDEGPDNVTPVPLESKLLSTSLGDYGLQIPAVDRLSGHTRPTARLNVIRLKTGNTVGAITGLLPISHPDRPSVWLLPKQGWLVQLDSERTMLLRKPVDLPK